jgi:hypothetical protein
MTIKPGNPFKDWLTTLLGLAIAGFTVYNVLITHRITWIWEGSAGLLIGLMLFWFRDEYLRKIIDTVINYFRKDGQDQHTPNA